MSYRDTYQSWLDSAVLSQEEKAELTAIQNDEKEIESTSLSSSRSVPPVSGAPWAWVCTA